MAECIGWIAHRYGERALGRVEDDLNLYAYTRNDPLDGTDPTGDADETCGSRVGVAANCKSYDVSGETSADSREKKPQAQRQLPGYGPGAHPGPDKGLGDVEKDVAGLVGGGEVKAGLTLVAGLKLLFRLGAKDAAKSAGEIVASNEVRISGLTRHGVNRAIGDAASRAGVRPQAALDALRNPKTIVEGIDSQGRPFQVFTGESARVIINPQTGKIVSMNPLSGAGAH